MNYLEWPLYDIFCCHTNFFVLCTIVILTCKAVTLGQKTIESVTKEIKYLSPLFDNNIRKYRHWRGMTWNTAVPVDTASCVTHLLRQRFCFCTRMCFRVLCKACDLRPVMFSCGIKNSRLQSKQGCYQNEFLLRCEIGCGAWINGRSAGGGDMWFAIIMLCWPCIVTYPYSKNQQDALFTFNLFQ